MTTPLLQISNLKVCFGSTPAVDEIDLTINKGETFVLLGESGCGKSMSAMCIMRLLPNAAKIESGKVLLDGEDLLQLPESEIRNIRGGKVGMIFQEPQTSLNPVMTIGDQIAESVLCHSQITSKKAVRARVIQLLNDVGISDAERRYAEYPHQFSGGMKQRVMIAIALAGEPELLIADEPSTALDVTIQAQVLDLLLKLQKERGMAILFITHDLGVAARMADHVGVMYAGKIVETAEREQFFKKPAHPYSQKLFDALPHKMKRELSEKDHKSDQEDNILLEVKNLDVHFPIKKGFFRRTVGQVRAVNDVSLVLEKGKTVAMVGESGSGKTTFGKGVLQLIKPTNGTVLFEGKDLTNLSQAELRKHRTDIQIVFQDPYSSMNPRMIVSDIIEEGMVAQKIGKSKLERVNRVEQLLEQVGLEKGHRLRYPHEFSGGQRQRICIARALAVDPKLIICDEPTSALDVSVQSQILTLLKDLQNRLGLSYLFITHNLGVVEYIADKVAVMYQGEIVEYGDVAQVLHQPQHPYTQKLLSAVLTVDTGT
ncbi:MAG: ABC transporter ATP-binding protein [Gammaproteobacteria bacterium]